MPTFSPDPRERAAEERCVADVERYGLHVMRVAGGDDSPEFAYTIGMVGTFGHPEIIILGLRPDTMHRILNHVAEEVRAGRRFAAGDVTDAFLEGYDVAFRAVPERQYRPYLGWATWFNGGPGYPALQLVYPDVNQRWPWDEGVEDDFRAQQPVLESEPVPLWAR